MSQTKEDIDRVRVDLNICFVTSRRRNRYPHISLQRETVQQRFHWSVEGAEFALDNLWFSYIECLWLQCSC